MRIWSNGKISLCQGEDAGSIPAIRHNSVMYYDKKLSIVDYSTNYSNYSNYSTLTTIVVSIIVVLSLPFFASHPKTKLLGRIWLLSN